MVTSSKIKMVIVARKDLNMRTGKLGSQMAHSACAFLIDKVNNRSYFTEIEQQWLREGTTKICLQAKDEAHLMEIYQVAEDAGLRVNLVEDEGLTEFGGVLTKTCIAIGPHPKELIDPITKDLKLF
jgi:PTH2 family peptidyl-tRNA hydrolase